MSRHVSNYVCDFQSRGILSARPYRLKAEAIAEVDAEDLVRADDYYHSRPYFRCADKQDFYKKPVLCAAHVVGIADPEGETLSETVAWKVIQCNMCLQPAYIDACRFTEEATMAARRPAIVTKVSPPIKG